MLLKHLLHMIKKLTLSGPLQVTVGYLAGAALWIVLTSLFLNQLNLPPETLSTVEQIRDLAFVLVTAAMLYVTLRQQISHRRAIEVVRDHTRDALVETASRYDGLETISPVGIFYADHTGQRMAFNKRCWEITGLTATQAMGDGWTRAVHPDDRARVVGEWRLAVQKAESFSSEYRVKRPDGATVWVVSQAVPLKDPAGSTEFLGVLTDITPRKDAEEALTQAASDYQLLFDRNPLPVWIYDLETYRFLAVNDTAIETYGYTREQFLAMTIMDIRPKDAVGPLKMNLAKDCDGKFISEPGVHLRSDGSRMDVQVTAIHIPYHGREACIIAVSDITEQIKAEEALRYQAGLLDVTPDAVISTDTKMRILSWNKAAEEIYGWSAEEVVGKVVTDIIPPLDLPDEPQFVKDLNTNGSWEGDFSQQRRDGSFLIAACSIVTIHDKAGNLSGYVSISRDATEFRRADSKLRQRNKELEALLSVSSALSGRFDLDVILDSITHATRELLAGVDRASLWLHDPAKDQIVLRAAAGFSDDIRSGLAVNGSGGLIAAVFRTRHSINIPDTATSDDFAPVGNAELDQVKSVLGVPLVAEGHVIGCLFCDSITQTSAFGEDEARLLLTLAGHAALAIQDARLHQRMQLELLERLRAEEAVHDSEELHRLAFKATPRVAIWDWHITSGSIRWSEGIETVYGYPPDELAIHAIDHWRDLIHPDDRDAVIASLEAMIDGLGQNWSAEYRFKRQNGTYAFVSDQGFAVRDKAGRAIRMIGSMVDITDQKIAEHALRESEERFRRIAESAPDMIFRWTLRSGFEYVSPAAKDIIGYTPEQFYLAPDLLHRQVHKDDVDKLDAVFDAGQDGTVTRSVGLRWSNKKGELVHIDLRYMPLRDEHGAMLGIEGIAHDVSQHILSRSRLRQLTQRLASAQDRERKRVALELHDDVGQTLTVAKMRLRMALNAIPEDNTDNIAMRGRLSSLTSLVDDSLQSIRALSHELHPPLLAEMGWQAALEGLCDSLSSRSGMKVTFTNKGPVVRLPPDTEIAVYRLAQEAITNALRHGECQNIRVSSRVSHRTITLEVDDDGRGFDIERIRVASQPGIGLGLLSMQERADAIEAKLTITSKPGHGTKVVLRQTRSAKG